MNTVMKNILVDCFRSHGLEPTKICQTPILGDIVVEFPKDIQTGDNYRVFLRKLCASYLEILPLYPKQVAMLLLGSPDYGPFIPEEMYLEYMSRKLPRKYKITGDILARAESVLAIRTEFRDALEPYWKIMDSHWTEWKEGERYEDWNIPEETEPNSESADIRR